MRPSGHNDPPRTSTETSSRSQVLVPVLSAALRTLVADCSAVVQEDQALALEAVCLERCFTTRQHNQSGALLKLSRQLPLLHPYFASSTHFQFLVPFSSAFCQTKAPVSRNMQTNTTSTGFGSNTSTGFGAPKSTFGASTSAGGGLFGSGTQTTGGFGGGFGANTANTSTSGFGGGSTGGGLFGQNKPAGAFGGTTTQSGSGSLFGSGGGAFGGGGATNTTTGFGSGSTGFGSGAGGSTTPQNTGTGNVQFEPIREKEGTSTSVFNSITMQPAYQQLSFEELRTADYAQGRKFGNQNGQAGAFGQSTGFGQGFGSSNTGSSGFGPGSTTNQAGGLFGAASNTSTGFGQQQQQQSTSSGFGGGGLFGAKPATTGGGLFGSTPATSGQQSGGLFGASGGSGFGSGTTGGFGSGSAGGGLFGQQQQQQQQNKPPFGGFGSTSTGTGFGQSSATGGFGQTATASSGGGLFGSGGTSSFGQQNTGSSFGGGGGFGQQNQTQNQGGGLFGSSFGNNQQQNKSAGGLFGSSQPSTGGGLFGSQPSQQQSGGGLFGATNTAQQGGGGLFGNKPATTGSNLFGSSTANTNTGGGLFGTLGQPNQQQNTGGGLFGQQNQQQKPAFGLNANTTSNAGGGLFGSSLGQSNNQQPTLGNSVFGGTQQSQQQMGNGLFASMQQNQQQQQPQQLTTSLLNVNPYGNDQLFASLGASTPSPGPIATPLSGGQKTRKPSILPQHKISLAASSRLYTPPKRSNGYGFSYSTYGTPGSAMGTPTGFLSSGSIGRSLGKSFSSSNLRNVYSAEESSLLPGAFTPGRSPFASNNMKRLSISRSIDTRRSNTLFEDTPKKKVNFEDGATNGATPNGTLNGTTGALVRTEDDSPTPPAQAPAANGQVNGTSKPEMEKTNGNALVTVPEDSQPSVSAERKQAEVNKEHARKTQTDQSIGTYWSEPSIQSLKRMTKNQLKSVRNFVVGRDGSGKIEFGTVDLSNVPLDRIFGDIVKLSLRQATVYGTDCDVPKPAVGKGLNMPSTITLENSWPRKNAGRLQVLNKSGYHFEKHLDRLKRVTGTEFVNYDADTGTWVFKVPHYTTYGLDYDDDEDEDMDDITMSGALPVQDPRESIASTNVFAAAEATPDQHGHASPDESSPDDTFHFIQGKPRKNLPGNFDYDDDVIYEDEEMEEVEDDSNENTQQSFLGDRSVGSLLQYDNGNQAVSDNEYATEEQEEMAGAFPAPVQSTELISPQESPTKLKSILKTSQFGRSVMDTPAKNRLILESNWTEQLQRTASPRKQTRQALRESQATVPMARDEPTGTSKPLGADKGFATSIDIMNSLFGRNQDGQAVGGRKQSAEGKGFEV